MDRLRRGLSSTAFVLLGLPACQSLTGLSSGPDAVVSDGGGGGPTDGGGDNRPTDAGARIDVSPPGYEIAVKSDGPIAHFRFEESSGTVCKDSASVPSTPCVFSVDGIFFGATGIGGGKAVRLTPSGQVTLIPSIEDMSKSFTVEFWIWIDEPSFDAGPGVFLFGSYAPTNGVHAWLTSEVKLRTETFANGTFLAYTLSPVAGSGWHHVAHGFDAASDHEFTYFDGTLCEGGAQQADAGGVRPTVSTPLTMGGWAGGLDELAIYDKPLAANRVLAHFAAAR